MLRDFRPNDLSQVYDIARVELKEDYSPNFIMDLHSFWPDLFLIVEDSGVIKGFIAGILLSEIHARIFMLAVRRRERRKSLGTLLCQEFIKRCALRGVRLITLEVRVSNKPAFELYRKLGFQMMMRLDRYYGDGESANRMQLIL